MTYQIIGPPAPVRLQPGYDSPQIGQANTGVVVGVIGQQNNATGDWFQVALTDGRTGWISSVSMAPEVLADSPAAQADPAPITSAPVIQAAPPTTNATTPAAPVSPVQPRVTSPAKAESEANPT
jgi:uncharacterized protein YgiM (DUF1202 family)